MVGQVLGQWYVAVKEQVTSVVGRRHTWCERLSHVKHANMLAAEVACERPFAAQQDAQSSVLTALKF